MDREKVFDGRMKCMAAACILIMLGFIEIVAAAYCLILVGWLGRELYRAFKIGQVERREYKNRELAWKAEFNPSCKQDRKPPTLAEAGAAQADENVVLDPL